LPPSLSFGAARRSAPRGGGSRTVSIRPSTFDVRLSALSPALEPRLFPSLGLPNAVRRSSKADLADRRSPIAEGLL
jgi:hypothetical protein